LAGKFTDVGFGVFMNDFLSKALAILTQSRTKKKEGIMAHYTQNINVRHRLTQIIVLILLILAGILFSQIAEARSPKAPRFDMPRYRVCVHSNSFKVVKVLYKKRHNGTKATMMASGRTSRKKAQAET
jgi:hypothetical protein